MNAMNTLEHLTARDESQLIDLADWLRAVLPAGAELRCDSRLVQPGDAFFAWPGTASDGRPFCVDAARRGAAALLIEVENDPPSGGHGPVAGLGNEHKLAIRYVQGLHAMAGRVACRYYGGAAERLDVVAVTGTNGKTTCTNWIAEGLSLLGKDCGVIGTLGWGRSPGALTPFGLTMPDALGLHAMLARLEREGARAVAMEATSIGLTQHRLDGVQPSVAVLTNLTRDHLDYHGTLEAYAQAKLRLFERAGLQSAVLNADDPFSLRAFDALPPGCQVIAYGVAGARLKGAGSSHLLAERITERADGLKLKIGGDFGSAEVFFPVLGRFNAANALACAATWLSMGYSIDRVLDVIARLRPVSGRLQKIERDQAPLAVVDYAHTPDALKQALVALRPVAQARGGRLICLFGAGGERDRGKRPEMGRIAEQFADRVILTSDNPRSESPDAIVAEIAAGMAGRPAQIEADRAAAIQSALHDAAPNDVVLIAGKGHEGWQEAGGERRPFSDLDHATRALADRPEPRPALNTVAALVEPPERRFTLRQAFDWLSVARLYGEGGGWISAVVTDSRRIVPGCLFIALRGERFDGHDYIDQALAQGAAAVLFDRWRPGISGPALQVPDARRALGEIASGWRQQFHLPLVAVAGSNGKTTVKSMIAEIFREAVGEAACLATPGNDNNEIGVPMTLLGLRSTHRLAVLELGMNHPGEMAWLASVTHPTVALVNNAQREHQEFIAGTEGSARENASVFDALPVDGVAVFPGDDPVHSPIWRTRGAGRKTIEFGLVDKDSARPASLSVSAAAGSRPEGFQMTIDGQTLMVRLSIVGAHNVRNALAAAACAHAAGVDTQAIVAGLERFRPVKGRLVERRSPQGLRVIDDSYNANPDSVRAAIDVLADTGSGAATLLVLGDMGEVGEQGPVWHAEIGAYAKQRGIGALLALGPASLNAVHAFGVGGEHFADPLRLIEALQSRIHADPVVLVKGSRFMQMERIVDALIRVESH